MNNTIKSKLIRFLPLPYKKLTPTIATKINDYVKFPFGFNGTNPSILSVGSNYLVCVRGVNYNKGSHGQQPTFNVGDHYMTVNRFILVDPNFKLITALSDLDNTFDETEDIKLFKFRGKLMGLASSPDPTVVHDNLAITLLTIASDYKSGSRQTIRSPFNVQYEKNWAPFVHDDELFFIYSFDPLIVLRYNSVTQNAELADRRFDHWRTDDLKFLLSGSSAGLSIDGGYIFVAHRRRISLSRRNVTYLSRMYFLEMPNMHLKRGSYFSIGNATLQFVNGLQQLEDDFVISYGTLDRNAHLSRFSRSMVMSSLQDN